MKEGVGSSGMAHVSPMHRVRQPRRTGQAAGQRAQPGGSRRGALNALNTGFLPAPPPAGAAPPVRLAVPPRAAGAEGGTVLCLQAPLSPAGLPGAAACGRGPWAAGCASFSGCSCCRCSARHAGRPAGRFRRLGRMGLSGCRASADPAAAPALASCVPIGWGTRCAAAGLGADCAAVRPGLGPAPAGAVA